MDYKNKYLKYKKKYLDLKKESALIGGGRKSKKKLRGGQMKSIVVADLLRFIYAYVQRLFIPNNYPIFHDNRSVGVNGLSWTYTYFSGTGFYDLTVNILKKLKAIATMYHQTNPSYYSKIKVVEDLIDIIGLYIECFQKSFGNRIILSIFPYTRSLNDLKISELCVIPANLIGSAQDFMKWKCYIYYPDIYGLPLNLPTGSSLDFLPCYQPNYSFVNTVNPTLSVKKEFQLMTKILILI